MIFSSRKSVSIILKNILLPIEEVSKNDLYARSKRITAYLNLVDKIVALKLNEIKLLPFEAGNEKTKYFDLLPDEQSAKEKI